MPGSDSSESTISQSTREDFEHINPPTSRPIQPRIRRPNNNPQSSSLPQDMSDHSSPHTGVYYLPVPGSKNAPKKFKGKFSEIKLFIKHYEKLCVQKKVTDPKEKIENLTQYCSRKVREFMEGLPSYSGDDWEIFSQDLLEFYDADRDTKRYKRGDLEAFCKQMRYRRTTMKLSHWKHFNRDFIRIAGWLESHKKVSSEELAIYYWKGIPQDFRNKLEARLLAVDPDHDLELPFDVDLVNKTAKSFLQRNRFDSDRAFSDDDSEDSDSEDSDSDSDDESDSDDDLKQSILKLKKKKARQTKAKTKAKKSVEFKDPVVDPPRVSSPKLKTSNKSKSDEVEDLIEQMNRLSINDPTYSVLYYRAYHLDPVIGDIMMKPVARQELSRRIANNRVNEIRANSLAAQNPVNNLPSPSAPVQRDLPPHMKPGSNAFQQAGPPPNEDRKCFGCGGRGHTIYACTEISALVTKGIVARGPTGRIVMADGTPIRRIAFDEPLTVAIERMRPVQSNYVALSRNVSHFEDSSDSENDAEEDVLVATRSMKKGGRPIAERTRPQHKRFDSSRTRGNDKENQDLPQNETLEDIPVPTVPTPFSIDNSIFNPTNEDSFMEDDSPRDETPKTPPGLAPKRPPRRSEVQAQVDRMNVLGRILSQPVTLAVGEVFGISKEMTASLREVLKPKTNTVSAEKSPTDKGTNLVETDKSLVAAVSTRAREMLIKLRMECDGKPIIAIIDTGSQLNIANTKVWKTIFRRPLDTKNTVSMNDAGGGESRLNGLVANVPLSCGNVATFANVYVGDKVPFDLLLGRPWQRGNFVSIDEREDGTYLLFKDWNLDVRHEVLVTPEDIVLHDPYSHEFYSHSPKVGASVNAVTVRVGDETSPMEVDDPVPQRSEKLDNKNSSSYQDKSRSMTFTTSDDVEMEDGDPPGLILPKNAYELQQMARLWSDWLGIEDSNEVQNDSSTHSLQSHDKSNRIGDEKNWKLVQVLTKTNTRDWRNKNPRLRTFRLKPLSPVRGRQLEKFNQQKREPRLETRLQRLWMLNKGTNGQTRLSSNQSDHNAQGNIRRHNDTSTREIEDIVVPIKVDPRVATKDPSPAPQVRTGVSPRLFQKGNTADHEKLVGPSLDKLRQSKLKLSETLASAVGFLESIPGNRGSVDIESDVGSRGKGDTSVGNPRENVSARPKTIALEQRSLEEGMAKSDDRIVRVDVDVEMANEQEF